MQGPTKPTDFQPERRRFIAAMGSAMLAGAGFMLLPHQGYALAKDAYVVGGNLSNDFIIHRLNDGSSIHVPSKVKGHGFFQHPLEPNLVFGVEKSGTNFGLVDVTNGSLIQEGTAPNGRSFYGHFAFPPGGQFIFSSQVDPADGQGYFTVYDTRSMKVEAEYKIVPGGNHDIALLHGQPIAVVTSSGVRNYGGEHKAGAKASRVENTSIVFFDYKKGQVVDKQEWSDKSLFCGHLKVLADNRVVCLMTLFDKYEGPNPTPYGPLLWTRMGEKPREIPVPDNVRAKLVHELLSVASSVDDNLLLVTNPRGKRLLAFSIDDLKFLAEIPTESTGVALNTDGKMAFISQADAEPAVDHLGKASFRNLAGLQSSHFTYLEIA